MVVDDDGRGGGVRGGADRLHAQAGAGQRVTPREQHVRVGVAARLLVGLDARVRVCTLCGGHHAAGARGGCAGSVAATASNEPADDVAAGVGAGQEGVVVGELLLDDAEALDVRLKEVLVGVDVGERGQDALEVAQCGTIATIAAAAQLGHVGQLLAIDVVHDACRLRVGLWRHFDSS